MGGGLWSYFIAAVVGALGTCRGGIRAAAHQSNACPCDARVTVLLLLTDNPCACLVERR